MLTPRPPVDWANVVLGGGATNKFRVFARDEDCGSQAPSCLFSPARRRAMPTEAATSTFFSTTSLLTKYALSSLSSDSSNISRQLVPKVKSIIDHLKSTLPKRERSAYDNSEGIPADQSTELLIVKGFDALTLVPEYRKDFPPPVVQIILASNQSIASSLVEFDLDSCCVAFTGTKVVALPRACRAVALGTNLFDPAVARRRVSSRLGQMRPRR